MAINRFVERPIAIISDRVFFILSVIQGVVFACTVASYFILFWIVWRKSPKRLGNYKWYIIINATFGFGYDLIIYIIHPYPLLPYPIVILHGLAGMLFPYLKDPQFLIYVGINIAVICMIGLVNSTTLMFLFRYLQTTQSPYLKYMSDMRVCFLIYILIFVINGALVFLPLNWQLLSNEALKAGIRPVSTEAFNLMNGQYSAGFSIDNELYYLCAGVSAFVLLMIDSSIMLGSTFGCHRYLRQKRGLLSEKTANLFRSLINMLVIDISFAFFTGFLSVSLSLLSVLVNFQFGAYVLLLALVSASCYPLFTHLLVLTYIEPYRTSVGKLLGIHHLVRLREAYARDNFSSTVQTMTNKRPSWARRSRS